MIRVEIHSIHTNPDRVLQFLRVLILSPLLIKEQTKTLLHLPNKVYTDEPAPLDYPHLIKSKSP
jgi:hypothetical protein